MYYRKSGKEIHYYGEETAKNIININKEYNINNLDDLFSKLLIAWDDKTVSPGCKPYYDNLNNPSKGQCTITAILVQDIFGGKLKQVKVGERSIHTLNEIDGKLYDLASDQFIGNGIDIPYENTFDADENEIKTNAEVMSRYNLLKGKIKTLD